MSFLKSPIRRFNELPVYAPPPGTYDPKFLTDVSATASSKMPRSRSTFGLKPKDSSTDKMVSNRNSFQSLVSRSGSMTPPSDPQRHRSASQQRSSSPFNASGLLRRNISHSQPPFSFRRAPIRPSTTGSHSIHTPLRSEQKVSIASTQTSEVSVSVSVKDSDATEIEIELQKELMTSTKLLNEEREKSLVLQAKIDANGTILADMKAQVERLEKFKTDWKISEKKYQDSNQILIDSKTELEQLLTTQKSQLSEVIDEKQNIQLQLDALHADNMELSDEDKQNSKISDLLKEMKALKEWNNENKEERKQLLQTIEVCQATIEKDNQEKCELNEEINKLKTLNDKLQVPSKADSEGSIKQLLEHELQRQGVRLQLELESKLKDRSHSEETLRSCIEEQKKVIESLELKSGKIEMNDKGIQTEAHCYDTENDSIIAALLSKDSKESSVGTTDPMILPSYDPTIHDYETDMNNNIISEWPLESSSKNKLSTTRKVELWEEMLGENVDEEKSDEGIKKVIIMTNAISKENDALKKLMYELSPERTQWISPEDAETTTEGFKEELKVTFQEGDVGHQHETELTVKLKSTGSSEQDKESHGNNWGSRSARTKIAVPTPKSASQNKNQVHGTVSSPSGSSLKGRSSRKDVLKPTVNIKVDKVAEEDN